MTTPITYGYVDGGYFAPGYLTELTGTSIEFIHATAGTISFAHGFRYPEHSLQVIQPVERTACNVPIYFDAVLAQVPFDTVWPDMLDAELAALRDFMFTDLPVFDSFTLGLVGQDLSFPVRFAERRLRVRHRRPGHNEVTFSLIRV